MKHEAASATKQENFPVPRYEPSAFAVELERRLLNRDHNQ
jgi:hypothetical protein